MSKIFNLPHALGRVAPTQTNTNFLSGVWRVACMVWRASRGKIQHKPRALYYKVDSLGAIDRGAFIVYS